MKNSKRKTQNHNSSKLKTEKLEIKVWVGLGVWIGYVWAKTVAGLAIHPYRSVRRMVLEREERVLLPVLLSPAMFLVGLMVVGRIGSYALEIEGMMREVVAGVLGVSLIGLLLWQGLMVVLVVRFWRVR